MGLKGSESHTLVGNAELGTAARRRIGRPSMKARFEQARLIYKFFAVLAFVIAAFVVLLGGWINSRATLAILDAGAGTGALFLQALLETSVQSLESSDRLSLQDEAALRRYSDQILDQGSLVALKVWLPDGSLVFSDSDEVDVEHPAEEIAEALTGRVVGRLSDHHEREHSTGVEIEARLYEVYAPLRSHRTSQIIAIGEFYQNADLISETLIGSVEDNWFAFFLGGLLAFVALVSVVYPGSNLIERQRADLEAQLVRQRSLTEANKKLHERIALARQNSEEVDRLMQKRLGADLHDGPCQHIGFVLLTIDKVENRLKARTERDLRTAEALLEKIRDSTAQAMAEIRAVSRGLTAPHLEGLDSVESAIRSVVSNHEKLTGEKVRTEIACGAGPWPQQSIAAIGHLVQEALNNSYKHARGADVRIVAKCSDAALQIVIEDDGPGVALPVEEILENQASLGIRGMKFRVEALGGEFVMSEGRPRGTRVTFTLPLEHAASAAEGPGQPA